jgi:hypothetical protein
MFGSLPCTHTQLTYMQSTHNLHISFHLFLFYFPFRYPLVTFLSTFSYREKHFNLFQLKFIPLPFSFSLKILLSLHFVTAARSLALSLSLSSHLTLELSRRGIHNQISRPTLINSIPPWIRAEDRIDSENDFWGKLSQRWIIQTMW